MAPVETCFREARARPKKSSFRREPTYLVSRIRILPALESGRLTWTRYRMIAFVVANSLRSSCGFSAWLIRDRIWRIQLIRVFSSLDDPDPDPVLMLRLEMPTPPPLWTSSMASVLSERCKFPEESEHKREESEKLILKCKESPVQMMKTDRQTYRAWRLASTCWERILSWAKTTTSMHLVCGFCSRDSGLARS